MKVLNFTIIGTDSSLFDEPIHKANSFSVSSAERYDILIKFDSSNNVPLHIKYVYVICFDNGDNYKNNTVKFTLPLSDEVSSNLYKNPEEFIKLNVPFFDLTLLPQSSISMSRMRPLINL